jgi:hypothetical protein
MSDTQLTVRLHELCELLHVSVHRPRLTFKIQNARVTAGGAELTNQQATSPAWKLMPAEMSAALDRLENQVGRLLDQYTERFRSGGAADAAEDAPHGHFIKGLYLVPQAHVEGLLGQLHAVHDEMRAVVVHWAEDTDRFRAAVRDKLGADHYALAKDSIPSLGNMLRSTRIDIVSIPFGLAMNQLKRAGERSFLNQARARTTEMVEQVMQQVIAGPRQELAAAVNSMRELIEADGRVTTRTVAPIRRAIEKIRMFDFVADDGLRLQIDNLSQTLDSLTPSEQTHETAVSNGLMSVLRTVAETALDEARITQQYQIASDRKLVLRRRAVPA